MAERGFDDHTRRVVHAGLPANQITLIAGNERHDLAHICAFQRSGSTGNRLKCLSKLSGSLNATGDGSFAILQPMKPSPIRN